MKQKDREIIKKIFSQISKLTYSELKSQFNKEYLEKLKIDTKYSNDLNIEGRLEREEHITNLDASQLKSFKSVVKSIQDNYLFTEDDIDRLNNFTSRLNYLLKSTSPHNRGMADQMNNIKHGARINPNAPTFTLKSNSNDLTNGNSKSTELIIHKFFNACIKSNTWKEFKSYAELDSSFFDKSFEWKLVYVFSNIKNCQDKTNYPLYYAAWQVTAEWGFDVEYGNYDAFCEHYRNIDFLDEPKLLHFSCYYYLLRLALRNDKSYQEFLYSKEEKEKQNIIKELRENEDDELYIKEESNDNKNDMASNNKFHILAINQLSRIFSIPQAGKEFDFTLSTSESSLSDSAISEDDFLIVSILDKVYYQFRVIDKTEEEIRLKKMFEIDKTIGYIIDEEGVFQEISQQEYDIICQKLFSDYSGEMPKTNKKVDLGNLKEGFADWLFQQGKYQRVYKNDKAVLIEKLSEYEKAYENDFGIAIFDFPNLSLETIIGELEVNVIDESGEIGDLNRRTVGNGSVKAILGPNNYIKFLKELSKQHKVSSENLRIIDNQKDFDISDFQNSCKNAGLVYSDKLITRFVSSLITKPFVILTGLSGSGKTQLAQAYVQWICQEESQYRIIPVGADWTNREPLLGYPNALKPEEYVKPDSGVIDLILQANLNPELPHFLILDEMNLSHVERYFADFLSVMESNEEIPLYADGTVDNGVPSKLKVPANLFIIGTVNIDETTNMFSPKVLDRANTIEFRINNSEMEGFLGKTNELNMKALLAQGANMAQSFISLSNNKSFTTKDLGEINKTLLNFFGELQKTGAEFGYRSASEILRLINQLDTLDNKLSSSEKLDIAIMQKLLPKLHGSRRKLCLILETLGSFCLTEDVKVVKDVFEKDDFDYYSKEVLYPLSLEKIARMYKGAVDNGFASYAEA
jgi:5-methylcytosine-specific restriction protein B